MKILELNFYLGGGGASRLMTDLSNYYASDISNQIVTVSVIESESEGNNYISFVDDLNPRVKYLALNKKSGLCISSLFGVYNLIKKVQPDVVHLHANIMLLLLPSLLCRRVKYVHTIHTLVTRQYSNGLIKRVANWLYKTKHVIPVTISQECHESYKKCFGRQDDILITNGRCALTTTEKVFSVKEELTKLGVSETTPVFLHVSRHHPVKNHDRMFKVFQRLADDGIAFQLIVIGDHYEEYEEELKRHKQIHLIGPRTNIGDYMSMSDYFVLTSDKEGLPLSLLEAMSMGVIPICTPAGGIKDVIRNGENGFMAEEISDDAYYHIVKQALIDKDKISRESIINEYKDKYSMEVCAMQYMKVYKY